MDEEKTEGMEPIDTTSGEPEEKLDLTAMARKAQNRFKEVEEECKKAKGDLEEAKQTYEAECEAFEDKLDELKETQKKEALKINYLVESTVRFMDELDSFLVTPGMAWREKIAGTKSRINRLRETIRVIGNGEFVPEKPKKEGPTIAEKLADVLAGKPKEKEKPKVKAKAKKGK
jgi:hypothetical protein